MEVLLAPSNANSLLLLSLYLYQSNTISCIYTALFGLFELPGIPSLAKMKETSRKETENDHFLFKVVTYPSHDPTVCLIYYSPTKSADICANNMIIFCMIVKYESKY